MANAQHTEPTITAATLANLKLTYETLDRQERAARQEFLKAEELFVKQQQLEPGNYAFFIGDSEHVLYLYVDEDLDVMHTAKAVLKR